MKLISASFQQDLLRLTFVLTLLAAITGIFVLTPALSTPALLSVVFTMLLSPIVAGLERRGYGRRISILAVYTVVALALALLGVWAVQSFVQEWDSLQLVAPEYFSRLAYRLEHLETDLKARYAFLAPLEVTQNVITWGDQTGRWFLTNGPTLVGDLVTSLFIIPFLTYVLLKDGPKLRTRFFELVPNRFFESAYMITTQIGHSMSDYIRAKIFEAVLVGVLVTIGLLIVNAPYAIFLGVIAGVTNIIPYAGPLIGAAPGVLIAALGPTPESLLIPMVIVYLIANIIDLAFIFPILVAKLVDLHPVVLITAVIIGQQYYGLVGMLISIPLAAAIKVIAQQVLMVLHPSKKT